jgi:glycosyltransferase involved in cell wall biosynthesis
VVVVNDGSGVSYNEIFDELPNEVRYLSYKTNMGKGHALKYGLAYIKENFDTDSVIVT